MNETGAQKENWKCLLALVRLRTLERRRTDDILRESKIENQKAD